MARIRVFRNEDIKSIAAFIPKGHRHVRLLIDLGDEVLVFQQATIDAIIRAYTQVALHPTRRAVILKLSRLSSKERKVGFAEFQLLEVEGINENELIEELTRKVMLRSN